MTPAEDPNSWEVWSKHVLAELERQTEWVASIQRTVNRIETELAILKYKSGLWGALAGLISVAMMIGVAWLAGNLKR